jgi:hypothetical protein
VTVADDDGVNRLRFRLWQLTVTALTVLITGWFVTFGAIAAILALMIAKHILVAVLVLGMDVDSLEPPGNQEPNRGR